MKKMTFVLLLLLIATPALAENAEPQVKLVKGNNKIDVLIAGRLFTSYIFGEELPKPSLVPVRTPGGIEVSRRHPLVEMKGGTDDHLHHVGLWFAVDNVNGADFWNNTETSPQIRHIKTTKMTQGKAKATLATLIQWIDDDGKLLLLENRKMTFLAGEHQNEYAIDFTTKLTAKDTKVTFDDTEEGVFAIRLADCLRESGPAVLPKKNAPLPEESVEGTGRYFSSNGDQTAENVWGKRARWVALQGVKAGNVVGVAILNHPQSINYPTYWHVRDYGLFSANPLGQGDFQRQHENRINPIIPLHLTLEPGESSYFRFRVIVFEGLRTPEQIEQRFKEFTK